jgi:hypothetical protein
MKTGFRFFGLVLSISVTASFGFGLGPEGTMAFTVSMELPHTHYFHVDFRCDGITGETLDFKMPTWTAPEPAQGHWTGFSIPSDRVTSCGSSSPAAAGSKRSR